MKHKDIIDKLLLKKKSYQERIKNLESGGRDPNRNPLRDGVSNLKDFSGGVVRSVASKPKDLALRIRNKFGSSDNITNDNSRTSETGDADPSRYLSDDVSSNSEIEPHGRSLHHGNGDKNARVRSWSQLNRGSPDYAEVREENNRLRQQLQLIMQNVMIIQSDVVEIKEAQARVNDSLERVQERAREDFLQFLTNFETEKIRSERWSVFRNQVWTGLRKRSGRVRTSSTTTFRNERENFRKRLPTATSVFRKSSPSTETAYNKRVTSRVVASTTK